MYVAGTPHIVPRQCYFYNSITKANPALHVQYFSAALAEKCVSHKSTISQADEGTLRYSKFRENIKKVRMGIVNVLASPHFYTLFSLSVGIAHPNFWWLFLWVFLNLLVRM